MKKLQCFFVSICFVVSFVIGSIPVMAAETIYDGEGNLMTQEEIQSAEEAVALGKQIMESGIQTRVGYNFNIPLLRQDDSRWANTVMACGHSGHTFGAVGCAMTSYAMIFRYFGHNVTPVDVARVSQNNGGPSCNFSSLPLCQAYGLSRENSPGSYSQAQIQQWIVGRFAQGKPCIVKLRKGSNTHFVVARAYYEHPNGATGIYIHDPESNINYSTLAQYLNNGWSIDFATAIIR